MTKEHPAVAYVRADLYGIVPVPENLHVIVASALTWIHDWNRETAAKGECNCNKCLGDMIDEILGESDGQPDP